MIDVLVGTFIGDTGAYLGGRGFGRRPLAPRISPNKTVEGLASGCSSAIAGVVVAGALPGLALGHDALLLGLGVAIAAPIGDLFESFVKRDAGTKDTGERSAPTAARSTASTRPCSPPSPGYYVWLALL